MSAPMGMYGGYQYESTEARALGSITQESYDYRDQGRLLGKLTGDVSYMAAYMRKMQKGIDDANQNFIQQIQSLIHDIIVIFGGTGDTGFDFGDLKYILQGFGALFGFDTSLGLPLPLNLFQAAWHFFSNYILPINNFGDAIDAIIDAAISTILDIFGEIPIVGQALQQLAVIISGVRDLLGPIFDAIEALFGAFKIDFKNIEGITDFFGPLKPIMDMLIEVLNKVPLPDVTQVFHVIAKWSKPFVDMIADAILVLADVVKYFLGGGPITRILDIFKDLSRILNVFDLGSGVNLRDWAGGFIDMILTPVGKLVNLVGGLIPNALIPILDATKIGSVALSTIGNWFQNLLSGGLFPWGSLFEGHGWSLDPLGLEGNAATISANGSRHGLSGVDIPAVEGRAIELEVNVKWEDLVTSGGGAPIVMSVILFDSNKRRIGTRQLASTGSSGNSNGWRPLKGQYIPTRGVSSVSLLVEVLEYARSGVVQISAASAGKIGLFELDWTAHLVKRWENAAKLMGIEDHDMDGDIDLQDVWASLITGKLNPLRLFEDFVGRLFSGSIVDDALEALTGIPIIGGLPKALARELGDLFNTANDAFARAWDFGMDLVDLARNLLTSPATVIGGMVNNLSTRIQNLTSTGMLIGSAITGTIANNLIPGLVNLINGLISAPANWIGGMVNNLATRIQNITTGGLFTGSAITGTISRSRIPVVSTIVDVVNSVLTLFRDLLRFLLLDWIVPPNIA